MGAEHQSLDVLTNNGPSQLLPYGFLILIRLFLGKREIFLSMFFLKQQPKAVNDQKCLSRAMKLSS